MNLHRTDGRAISAAHQDNSRLARLRILCLIEASTLLALLLVAVPLKHLAGYPLAVAVMGPLHGFVFLTFGWFVIRAVGERVISGMTGGKLMLAACLPFGGIYSWRALR